MNDPDSSIVGTYDTSDPKKWVAACREHCRLSIANTGTGAWLCIALAMIESLERRLTETQKELCDYKLAAIGGEFLAGMAKDPPIIGMDRLEDNA